MKNPDWRQAKRKRGRTKKKKKEKKKRNCNKTELQFKRMSYQLRNVIGCS